LKKLGALGSAAGLALIILVYGQDIWGALAFANLRFHPDIPWAAPTMAGLLAVLLAYLNGAGWPRRTADARRRLLRFNPMPKLVFAQALLAGVLALAALGGFWLVTSDLVHIPRGLTPDMHGYPLPIVISLFIMGCIAAPLSEEAAFRGYAQGVLERAWGYAPATIIGSALLFAAAHVIQGLSLPKLSLYFTAGVIFGAIAYLTNSLLASIVVHSLGDAMGFLLLWPHDAQTHGLISEGGHDPVFWPALIALVVFTPLALWAFTCLAAMTRSDRASNMMLGLAAA
jgi:membrane protease YdiL (CAAX protease family)